MGYAKFEGADNTPLRPDSPALASQYAPIASPTFTGNVVVPDADADTEALNRQTADARYAAIAAVPKLSPYAGTYIGSPVTSVSSSAVTQSLMTATPLVITRTTTFDRIRAEVTSAVASSTVRLGIYASHSTSAIPDTLVLDAGTINGNSATAQEITISQSLSPGLYWLTAVSQGGAPTVRVIAGCSSPFAPMDSSVSQIRAGYGFAGVTGALPASFGTASPVALAARVFLRAA